MYQLSNSFEIYDGDLQFAKKQKNFGITISCYIKGTG